MPSGSNLEIIKHRSKVRTITRSLMALFVTKKRTTTFITRKDEYYKNFWLNKTLCDGIKLVADIESRSKKAAAELLMKAGLSSYMGA